MRAIAPITRSTARLHLRPLTARDRDPYLEVLRASATAWERWTPARDPSAGPDELFRREVERTTNGLGVGTHVRLGGFDESGSLVGLFALNEIVRGVFESGYASWQVRADRWGLGYGTEGARCLLAIAFDTPGDGLGLHRVQANIMPSNDASLRIAAKVGFRREGLAERYLRIAGRWEDHVMFAITREEWAGPDQA